MRLLLVIGLCFGMAACGFQATYAPQRHNDSGQTAVSSKLADIAVDIIPNREGQYLRNRLIDRFYKNGYPAAPNYRLSVSPVRQNIIEIGIDKDSTASRAQLRVTVDSALYDNKTNQIVLRRTQRATTGYNILASQFTTFVTEADAREQGLNMLAEQITTQLELYFSRADAPI